MHHLQNIASSQSRQITQAPDQPLQEMAKQKRSKYKKMACVECRQQKSKCDAQERYPNPCTRCSKKQIPCSVQADYKRTYKRAKFQQIEEELEVLKKNLTEVGSEELLQQLKEKKITLNQLRNEVSESPSPVQPQQIVSQGRSDHSSAVNSPLARTTITPHQVDNGPSIIRDSVSPTNNPIQPGLESKNRGGNYMVDHLQLTEDALLCTPKQFGEVHLSSQQIRDLFVEFVNRYHKFLPLVDVGKGPERIYRLCPILFWVIVSIALRHLSTDTLMTLAPLLKTALAEITISPITRYLPDEKDEPILNVSSVYSVQAFILYTYWPPLTSSLSADSSWNTVGIAVFQAIRLGLNGPGTNKYNIQQQNDIGSILKEHVQTWIACNIASQTIGTAFGFPSFVSFDSSVTECCRQGTSNTVPLVIRHMVEISRFEDGIAKVLNSNNANSTGLVDTTEKLPLLKVLAQQLAELELKLTTEGLDDIRKFQICATKVHLLTYHFLDNSRVANFELHRGLVSLYNAALSLLSHANSMAKRDPTFFRFVPGVFVLEVWQASCVVAKLVHSTLSDVIDVGTGRQLYIAAIQMTMSASILKHDMAYRSSGIMRNMWQLFKALREKTGTSNLDVTINSRMSASVFFDCLWVLREQVGMIKLDPNPKPSSGESSNNEAGEEEDYDEEDEVGGVGAVESRETVQEEGITTDYVDPGTVNSESSDAKSTSSQKKRPRSLSNNFNAENAARKIIRTIPLDPAPISLRGDSERSPVPSSSSLRDILQKASPESLIERKGVKRQPSKGHPSSAKHRKAIVKAPSASRMAAVLDQTTSNHMSSINERSPQLPNVSPTNIPSLDLDDNWTSDMLWKDVDSVMNDFGFNIDDLTRSLPAGAASTSHTDPTGSYGQHSTPSLF